MMSTQGQSNPFVPSIDELLITFRRSLQALVPMAESARISWRDSDTHIDWENVAEALYDAFVAGPIRLDRHRKGKVCELARYDFDIPSYVSSSWIEVDRKD